MAATRRALQWDDVTEGQRIIVEWSDVATHPITGSVVPVLNVDRGVYQGMRRVEDNGVVVWFAVLWRAKDEFVWIPSRQKRKIRFW